MPITALIVDDHPVFRMGLRLLLEETDDLRVVGEAEDGQAAIDRVRELDPDVVLMDITMPRLSGVDATRQILSQSPRTKVIALSIHGERSFIEEMLEAGAAGYLLKDSIPEELANGVRAVMRGGVVLSAAVANEVVSGYRQALSNGQVSRGEGDRTGASPILETRLHRPSLGADLVPRPHLLARLEEGLSRPLTLVCAAAGTGKTTLLAAWLAACDCPSAWIQLAEEDSDLVFFIAYLQAAIRALYPDIGGDMLAQVLATKRPPLPVLVRGLLHELDRIEGPFVLVLDDYHKIQDGVVHEVLAALLQRLPPNVHLAIATRSDPPLGLTGLRARGQVLEIRGGDLAFTPEEAHVFLEGVLGRELSRETTEQLGRKTEGWIAGLRLAALSMRGLDDVEAFARRFEGTSSAYVADYMLDEVLARQRPEVQDFVLKASILDRFCASLCDALLDDRWSMTDPPGTMGKGASTHSLEMLNAIHHDNLFLLSLDPQGTWYRFHHLFQDLLRQRLEDRTPAAELAALHARASAWFVEQGLVDEALVHALAAGDVARAAEIVEQSRHDAIYFGRCHLLERWSERLPEDIQGQRPELLLAQAWVLFHHFDLQLIPAVLEKAEQALAEEGSNDGLQGEIDFFRGYFSYFQGQAAQAIQYHTSARQKIPETVPMFKAEAELHYALSLHMNGLKERALDGLSDWIHSSRTSEGVIRARAWAGLAFIHLLEGDLGPAAYAVRHWVELAEEARDPFVETWGSYLDALMHVYGGEPDRAVQGFEPLVAQRHIMQSRVATDILCALSLAYEHGQRPDQADGVVRLLLEFARHTGDPAYRTIASSCQARLSLLRGDMASALRWLRTADLATDAGIMLWWVEVPRLTACRVLVAEGSEASLQQAIDKLEQYDRENRAVHNALQRIGVLSLLALATHKQERTDDALAILDRAIALGEPGGIIQPLADLGPEMAALLQELVSCRVAVGSLSPATATYLNRVFAAFVVPTAERAQAVLGQLASFAAGPMSPLLVEPLTEREMEVLVLLAQRLTNQEIAQKLVISLGTVKQHTHNIYGKLGVQDRRQAVARALELELLSPP